MTIPAFYGIFTLIFRAIIYIKILMKGYMAFISYKSIFRNFFILPAFFFLTIISFSIVFAAQEYSSGGSGPLVVAPEGLTGREQAQLEQQYRYAYRGKDRLLSPYLLPEGAPPIPGTITQGPLGVPINEQEKLYRYFGVAVSLRDAGRFDEAIEILKYIVEKNPRDEYVKSYLRRMMSENATRKADWRFKTKNDARLMKKQKIGELLSAGTDAYRVEDYDEALFRFSEVLELDPGNQQALQYMDKLKKYYKKEVRIEQIVAGRERELAEEDASGQKLQPNGGIPVAEAGEGTKAAATQKLLDKKQTKTEKAAEKLLDSKEMEAFIAEKRVQSALDQAELGLAIEQIVEQKKKEDRESTMMTLSDGDVIGILVYEHPELSGRAVIGPTGEVRLPLAGDLVMVKGMTVDDATEAITAIMRKYVRDPYVTVSIEWYNRMFYVVDELGCTPYQITRANFTLRDALFLSDWGDNRALGRVLVMKPGALHPIVKKVDAFALIYRGDLSQNMPINNGDVIYVPMTVVGKVAKTVTDTMAPVGALQNARNLWLQGKWSQKGLKSIFRIYPDTQDLPEVVGSD